MNELAFAGCRPHSLLGYLKALGILRLIAQQADPLARGVWKDDRFFLQTTLSDTILRSFLLESYSPTPIANPWNNGAGFDGKTDTPSQTMERIRNAPGPRWEPYRSLLNFLGNHHIVEQRTRYLGADDKFGFVKFLRASCPESFLVWLDASIVVGVETLTFPYLLGSGGNDGRLDFAANFAARLLDVCGDPPRQNAAQSLNDCLENTAKATLIADAAIGQFSPWHAGGANATTGFSSSSLVNPWDFILMLEGATLFTGAISKRNTSSPGRAVFPYAVRGIAGGYGSSSEEEETRGELLLPIWQGSASFSAVADMLAKGRIDLPNNDPQAHVRTATQASEAITAIVTRGLSSGIDRIERIGFMQRNGLAFAATSLGTIQVHDGYDVGLSLLSRKMSFWVDSLRKKHAIGISTRTAIRAYDHSLFAYANLPLEDRTRARQDLLTQIARIDASVAHLSEKDDIRPAPLVSCDIIPQLDDQTSLHRIAIAIASYGAGTSDKGTREDLRAIEFEPERPLITMIQRRLRKESNAQARQWLTAGIGVDISDVVQALIFTPIERRRFALLLQAYRLIDFSNYPTKELSAIPSQGPSTDPVSPVAPAYALLKLVFDHSKKRDERILRLLSSGQTNRALELTMQRGRTIQGLPCRLRDISGVQLEDPEWTAALLAVPLKPTRPTYKQLFRAILVDQNKDVDSLIDEEYPFTTRHR